MERYISFENIDCFKNACCVVDELMVLLKTKPEAMNPFWEIFTSKLPESYFSKEENEDLLYMVCSNVFYIEELFDEYEHSAGIEALRKAELECC